MTASALTPGGLRAGGTRLVLPIAWHTRCRISTGIVTAQHRLQGGLEFRVHVDSDFAVLNVALAPLSCADRHSATPGPNSDLETPVGEVERRGVGRVR